MKSIEAICVTSTYHKRQQIEFDEKTGLIMRVGDLGLSREKLDYFFGDDVYLFAGMGDVHIHAREDVSGKNNYKEDFSSSRKAMHNGGLCHAGDMPNNPIPPVDDETYRNKFNLALDKCAGELWIYAGIGPGTRPLSEKVPYKVYMGPSIGELFFKDLQTLDETLRSYRDCTVSFHCEDPIVLEQNKNKSQHHEKRPVEAEVVATKDAISLIEKYGLKGKLCHFSSGEGLKAIREARKRGTFVQIEVTPQHLYFDLDQIREEDFVSYQMNPPIRKASDREALFLALKNGEIDFLATDHAPHSPEEKARGTSGLTGLDTFGPFVTWLLAQGISPQLIASITAENPGTFFNQFIPSFKKISLSFPDLGLGVGFLRPGFRANFTLLNLNRPILITKDKLKTKSQSSPFLGITFPGQVEALFIGGQKV
jgi:dihydroorotase